MVGFVAGFLDEIFDLLSGNELLAQVFATGELPTGNQPPHGFSANATQGRCCLWNRVKQRLGEGIGWDF